MSAARRLNLALMRTGKLFAHRYHSRALCTPREVRNALRYVLLNRKHHDAEKTWGSVLDRPVLERGVVRRLGAARAAGRAVEARAAGRSPCGRTRRGSASCWAQPVRPDAPWKRELLEMAKPTAAPETWLLATGWKRAGLLKLDERPS